MCNAGCNGLHAERQPEDALDHPKAPFTKDGRVTRRPLNVIAEGRAIQRHNGFRQTYRRAGDKEQPQQRGAQGQQQPEQGQLHGIGGLRPRHRACHVAPSFENRAALAVQLVLSWKSWRMSCSGSRGGTAG